MGRRDSALVSGFWVLALLWLPAEVIGALLIEFFPYLGATPSEDELGIIMLPLVAVPMGEVQLWVRLLPIFATTLLVFSPAGLMVALPSSSGAWDIAAPRGRSGPRRR